MLENCRVVCKLFGASPTRWSGARLVGCPCGAGGQSLKPVSVDVGCWWCQALIHMSGTLASRSPGPPDWRTLMTTTSSNTLGPIDAPRIYHGFWHSYRASLPQAPHRQHHGVHIPCIRHCPLHYMGPLTHMANPRCLSSSNLFMTEARIRCKRANIQHSL